MATTELELQEITALPKKVSSQITVTDCLMGIDSAEGYQMLIKDLGDYIIQKVTSSINGQDQTLVQALSALDSKLLVQTGGNITADNVNNLKEPAIYSRYIEAVAITGDSSMGNHFGLFIVTNSPNAERVGQYILMPNSGRVAMRYDNSGTWTTWQILATKAEVDTLNSNTYLLTGGVSIPKDANIDTYTTPGKYGTFSSTIARTLSGLPFEKGNSSNTAFNLIVENSAFNDPSTRRQILQFYNDCYQWVRYGTTSSWTTSWERQPTRAEMNALVERVAALENS